MDASADKQIPLAVDGMRFQIFGFPLGCSQVKPTRSFQRASRGALRLGPLPISKSPRTRVPFNESSGQLQIQSCQLPTTEPTTCTPRLILNTASCSIDVRAEYNSRRADQAGSYRVSGPSLVEDENEKLEFNILGVLQHHQDINCVHISPNGSTRNRSTCERVSNSVRSTYRTHKIYEPFGSSFGGQRGSFCFCMASITWSCW